MHHLNPAAASTAEACSTSEELPEEKQDEEVLEGSPSLSPEAVLIPPREPRKLRSMPHRMPAALNSDQKKTKIKKEEAKKPPITFEAMADILEPRTNSETFAQSICAPVWKKIINKDKGLLMFYSMDLQASVPRMAKCVRIQAEERDGFLQLIPSIFTDQKPDTSAVTDILGHSTIETMDDFMKLLKEVGVLVDQNVAQTEESEEPEESPLEAASMSKNDEEMPVELFRKQCDSKLVPIKDIPSIPQINENSAMILRWKYSGEPVLSPTFQNLESFNVQAPVGHYPALSRQDFIISNSVQLSSGLFSSYVKK